MEKKKSNLKFTSRFIFKNLIINNLGRTILGKNKIIYKKNDNINKKFLNNDFFIFKGLNFRYLKVNCFNFNYKFGNFVLTRKPFKYIEKEKIESKKNLKR